LAAVVGVAGVIAVTVAPTPARAGTTTTSTTTTTEPPSAWRGNGPPCKVLLPAPGGFKVYGTFYTCPPKRVLIIGDSVSMTMGFQMAMDEENWGTVVDDGAILGCAFVLGYEVNGSGKFGNLNTACNNEVTTWQNDILSFKPQALVIELGWWDSMQHLINGKVWQLGETAYDDLVLSRMKSLINSLDVGTKPLVYLLTVPWMDPAPFSNRQHQIAATSAFHDEINNLLSQAAAANPTRVHVIDISPYITPSGHYQLNVDGQPCRTPDGVHLLVQPAGSSQWVSTPCGRALQKGALSIIRQALA
jgi:hypothetical protein